MTHHVRSMKNMGPLHDTLIRACPPDPEGFKSIPILAVRLEMSAYGIYKWIKAGKLPPDKAKRVVEMNNGFWDAQEEQGKNIPEDARVSLDDFHQFVYA